MLLTFIVLAVIALAVARLALFVLPEQPTFEYEFVNETTIIHVDEPDSEYSEAEAQEDTETINN